MDRLEQLKNMPWDMNRPITVPQRQLPAFRTDNAIRLGVERNILGRTWGGYGDQICAEPTLRFMLKMFKDCQISLASEVPELFKHLQFKRVFDLKEESPNYSKYLLFDTITSPDESNLVWMFFSHLLTNCVDFPSLCALRQQLPVEDREILVTGTCPSIPLSEVHGGVAVHPGAHWQSKTFPAAWWNRVLASLRSRGVTPILIGAQADDNRGTVNVNSEGCIDLRDKLTISESIWVTQNVECLITNDSAPLHMAAAGKARVGYIATCKHPDMITHWRRNDKGVMEWQWREKNFSKGGIWEHVDYCPNKSQTVEVERVDPKLLESWLPEPHELACWAANEH